jgi:hypothetical protein
MYCLLFLNFVPHVPSAIAFDPQIYSRTRLFSNSGTSAFLFALLLSIIPFFFPTFYCLALSFRSGFQFLWAACSRAVLKTAGTRRTARRPRTCSPAAAYPVMNVNALPRPHTKPATSARHLPVIVDCEIQRRQEEHACEDDDPDAQQRVGTQHLEESVWNFGLPLRPICATYWCWKLNAKMKLRWW